MLLVSDLFMDYKYPGEIKVAKEINELEITDEQGLKHDLQNCTKIVQFDTVTK